MDRPCLLLHAFQFPEVLGTFLNMSDNLVTLDDMKRTQIAKRSDWKNFLADDDVAGGNCNCNLIHE